MTTSIGFCEKNDASDVMQFIKDHWNEDHILASHKGLFDWQYWDPENGRYNFVLCRRDHDQALLGILGFIPTYLYDLSLIDKAVLWLALWKVRPDSGIAGLGIFLHQYLIDNTIHTSSAVSGLNRMSHQVMSGLSYRPEVLQHYYLLNPTIKAFHIAHVDERPRTAGTHPLTKSLKRANSNNLMTNKEWAIGDRSVAIPEKSPAYFLRRFVEHPYYDYQVYAVHDGNKRIGLIAVREIEHEECRVLRIVDYWGSSDGLLGLGSALENLVVDRGAEYIDCLCWGLPDEVFIREGFSRLDPTGNTIIPDYFEPFERRNVPTRVAFKAPSGSQFLFFKADGDQDRPNRIPS